MLMSFSGKTHLESPDDLLDGCIESEEMKFTN